MMVFVEILVTIMLVLFMPVLEEIGGERFPCQHIPAVTLVGEDIANGPRAPICSTGFRFAADIRKKGCDLLLRPPGKKRIIDKSNHFRLCFIDHKRGVFYISSGHILRTIISKRSWG